MTIQFGKDAKIYLNGVDVSGDLTLVGLKPELELKQYAVFDGSSAYRYLPGLAKNQLTLEGISNQAYIDLALKNLFAASSGYQFMILFGETIGDAAMAAAEVLLRKYENTGVVVDIMRVKAELFLQNYPFDDCYLLSPKTARTGSGDTTALDNGAGTTSGINAYIQVFGVTGGGTLTVKVQHSTDNGVGDPWGDLVTFTNATGVTTEKKTIAGTVKQYLRVDWSLTAGTGTFAVVAKRT